MKILFVTFYFPPYNSIGCLRLGKTVKGLIALGHDVHVISADEQGIPTGMAVEIPKENIHYAPTGLKLTGENAYRNSKNRMMGISFERFSKLIWMAKANKIAKNIIKEWQPDVIFASSSAQVSLILASYLSFTSKIPWVGEFRDLWVDNLAIKTGLAEKTIEKLMLKQVSALISVSDPLVKNLQRRYPTVPAHEIRNAFDEEDFPSMPDTTIAQKQSKTIIGYMGKISLENMSPLLLLNAINDSPTLREKFEFHYYGAQHKEVQALITEHNMKDIAKSFPVVPRNQALEIQRQADILLLLTWNLEETGVFSGKIFEYIGAAKPILAVGNTDCVASDLITENGFGLASNDQTEIHDFLQKILQEEAKNQISENYKKNRQLHSRHYQIKKLEGILSTAASKI